MNESPRKYLGQTVDVKAGHDFDERQLEAFLRARVAGFQGPLSVKQFESGQSNLTYVLRTPARSYVLRRKPPGKLLKSAHAVDREFRVMRALGSAGFPVPEVLVLSDDESIVGTMFYVMAHVPGRVFLDCSMPDLAREQRSAVYDSVNAVLARVPGLAGVGSRQRPGIVHRLDKDTSGLLVVAKTPVAYASLSSQVARRTVNRTYLALVHGVLPHDERTITAPIGRHPRHRTRMAVVSRGREAITRYRVLERLARYTLVEAHLVTGRTHQIRVHFAHIGHPVAGDPVYAGRPDELGIGRQALHAHRLQFLHPASGKEMAFEAPPPADFTAAVERARAQGAAQDRRKGRHR